MSPLNIFLLVCWAISGVLSIIFILMHSGKGTGLSDMLASSMYNSNAGTGIVEKNLDRLTVVCCLIFVSTLVAFMLTFPLPAAGTDDSSSYDSENTAQIADDQTDDAAAQDADNQADDYTAQDTDDQADDTAAQNTDDQTDDATAQNADNQANDSAAQNVVNQTDNSL